MENDARCWNVAANCIIVRKSMLFWSRVMRFKSAHAQKHQNRLCVPCICVWKKHMYHSIGYTSSNDITLLSWNQVKTRHRYFPLIIFVCLYQQNLFWYHQDPYIPTGAKLYPQKPKCTLMNVYKRDMPTSSIPCSQRRYEDRNISRRSVIADTLVNRHDLTNVFIGLLKQNAKFDNWATYIQKSLIDCDGCSNSHVKHPKYRRYPAKRALPAMLTHGR